MSASKRRISAIIADFVKRESQDPRVIGILLFGSLIKRKTRRTSDIDLLVVRTDIEEYSRTKQIEEGIPLEVHTWPLELFERPFKHRTADALSYAFGFEVMLTSEILHDPRGILGEFKRHAETEKIPSSILDSLVEKAHEYLHLAKDLMESGELEGAEIETRRAAEELARAMLLRRHVLEINPPKNYLPHLRSEFPDFYEIFREVQNLQNLNTTEIELDISNISNWRSRTAEEIRRLGEEEQYKGAISGSETELSNAKDCLEDDDLEGARLQMRYSAIILATPILRLSQGTSPSSHSARYAQLIKSNHPYGDVMRSVMDFYGSEERLSEQTEILEELLRQFR